MVNQNKIFSFKRKRQAKKKKKKKKKKTKKKKKKQKKKQTNKQQKKKKNPSFRVMSKGQKANTKDSVQMSHNLHCLALFYQWRL